MSTSTIINACSEPQKAYHALLAGLLRMCAHCPLIIEDSGAAAPELLPAPKAVFRDSGYIGFTAQQGYDTLPGQTWTIAAGDTLVIEPGASYGPGDTLLAACVEDEFTLVSLRGDGSFCCLRGLEEFEPEDYLVIGPVVEVRRKSQRVASARLASAQTEAAADACEPPMETKLLMDLGSLDTDNFLPELVPAPSAVSQCTSGAGGALAMPGCFAMTVLKGGYDFPNKAGWKIQRGDTLIFNTDTDGDSPYGVFLALQDGHLTLIDGDMRSLRDGERDDQCEPIAPAVQYRPAGQIGGGQ